MIMKKKNKDINWNEFWRMLVSHERTVKMRVEQYDDCFKFVNLKNDKSCEITKAKIEKMVTNNKLTNPKICQLIFNNARKRTK